MPKGSLPSQFRLPLTPLLLGLLPILYVAADVRSETSHTTGEHFVKRLLHHLPILDQIVQSFGADEELIRGYEALVDSDLHAQLRPDGR